MTFYADSSFLTSLYLIDGNYPIAERLMPTLGIVLPFTSFGAFELTNAVRAAVFRRSLTPERARQVLASIQSDTYDGPLTPIRCDWESVFHLAQQFSARHTSASGHRALDVLHVATAKVLGCTDFLTFDVRQADLARQVGMHLHP